MLIENINYALLLMAKEVPEDDTEEPEEEKEDEDEEDELDDEDLDDDLEEDDDLPLENSDWES